MKSLFSYPLSFPSFLHGLLPVEIEPMQTEPWSRPAACSDCIPGAAAGPHCVAAVSITKKEEFQLSMALRTRTFARPGKQIANVWPFLMKDRLIPKKISLNPKIVSVATKVMLKCWDACDRHISGMQLLEEKNMPDARSPHTYLFLQLNTHTAVSYMFMYCNTLPDVCVLTSNQAHSHLLICEGIGDTACIWCICG